MIRFKIHPENPNIRSIRKAVEILEKGGLIIYPTDTVYGVGCNLYIKNALEKLYRLKGKSKFDPVSIIVKDIQQASQYVKISNYAYRVLKHCLPGPFTFILPATREIPKIMLSKRKEVGIRIPDFPVCSALLTALEKPIVNTSVNLDHEAILIDPDEIEKVYDNKVDIMLDVGWLHEANESTVTSLIEDELTILREGKGDISKLYSK
jgi:tRNA threonylcarbamoyl adenosine modification protein (Sua5/YciO/YrdC/YwlC family)